MNWYTNFVIKHRKSVVIVFAFLTIASILLLMGVNVNYKMADYLPPSAQSTKAVKIMKKEFTQAVPNSSVMVSDVSVAKALEYKEKLLKINGITEVLWLDDMVDVAKPLEMYDQDTVEGFYKNGKALYSVTIKEGMEPGTIKAIRKLTGKDGAVAGEAADTNAMRSAASGEVKMAVLIIVPTILLILILSTTSWLEPFLFVAAIGTSIVINMGTNIFLGQISFITNSVSPILQLAVSLDYAIFLLHSYGDYKRQYDTPENAMSAAMKKSVKTVAASALTTLFGFIALAFMDFRIGADLGLNLAKGIALSFISCMVFLPCLTLMCNKLIQKSQHREFMPSFKNVNSFFSKVAIPVMVIVVVLTIPAFLGQRKVDFLYGNGETNAASRNYHDNKAIKKEFGENNTVALLVPKGEISQEYELSQELGKLQHITGIMSFASQVGTGIPKDFLAPEIIDQFYSKNYARIIIYTDTKQEGEAAFKTVEEIKATVNKYYKEFYFAGQSANLYDMKSVVAIDNNRVNLIAIAAIFLVLLFSLQSVSLPFILIFTIEIGIWINLSIPYFAGSALNFLGYLVISTVQLGATVDYAILFTTHYLDLRKETSSKKAIHTAMGETFKSILVSGSVLAIAGLALNISSSNPIVGELGMLLARGTLLSMFMVFCLLPALLRIFDGVIRRTTCKAGFFKAKEINFNGKETKQ